MLPWARVHRSMPGTHSADVQREDEDDEEAQVPGQQRAEQHHALLPPEVSIPMQEEQRQEKHHHDLDGQSGSAHPAYSSQRAGPDLQGVQVQMMDGCRGRGNIQAFH